MSDEMRHPSEDLQALLDGRLDAARQAEVHAHVATCARCRDELEHMRWVKSALQRIGGPASAPPDVERAVRAALDEADPDRATRGRLWTAWPVRIAVGAALLAALVIGAVLWLRPARGIPSDIAADFMAYRRGELTAERTTHDPAALERYFRERGLAFRVIDLAMMQYSLVGGRVHSVRGQPSTVAFYHGPRGELVLCEMYEGDLPSDEPSEVRRHGGIDFSVYRLGDVTVVFWPEGRVTCILVSDMDPEALIQLAFEKAKLAT